MTDEEAAGDGPLLTDDQWRALPALPALEGAEGLREWLPMHAEDLADAAAIDQGIAACLAVSVADARHLFDAAEPKRDDSRGDASAAVVSSLSRVGGATADDRIVRPEGGVWKSKVGKRLLWTDEAKKAMRQMRCNGMSDEEIGQVARCTRQAVYSLLGSPVAARNATARMANKLSVSA